MKVLIIGCGAVGLSMATALCQAGAQVELAARGETGAAIRASGIRRRGVLGDVDIAPDQIHVVDEPGRGSGGYDYIIVSAKTTSNRDIAAQLARAGSGYLAEGGILLLFQNGFGNEEPFLDVYAKTQIYHASLTMGFKRTEPNTSQVTVSSAPVSLGSIFGQPPEPCQPLAEALARGGIPCRVSPEIGKAIWAKLLYNCALNPLSAILGTTYGGLLKSEGTVAIINSVIEEIFAVMEAAGERTYSPDAEAYKKIFYERILPPTCGHRSSTLQDIERRMPTEIDTLNGAVVALGQQLQVETPANLFITRIIKAMESLYEEK